MRTPTRSAWLIVIILFLVTWPNYAQSLKVRLDIWSGNRNPEWTIENPVLVNALEDALKGPALTRAHRLPCLGFLGFDVTASAKNLPPRMTVTMGLIAFQRDGEEVFVRCPASLERMLMQLAPDIDTGGQLAEYESAIRSTEAGTPADQIGTSQEAVKWALLRYIAAGDGEVIVAARRLVAQDRPLPVMLAVIDAIRDFGNVADLTLLESLSTKTTDPTVKQSCQFAIHKLGQRLSGATAN